MSRPADNLPSSARAIALLLSSTPSIQDVQPGVLHQLLEFSHRYTAQVLTDAGVYAEHAGRSSKLEMDDIVLAVQARVGWEFGGRVPKEYLLSLATETNAVPLPAVPEVFGVRLPRSDDCLTSIDFDLIPNKPPPDVKLYDEEIEEVEESETEDEDEDMEPAAIPLPSRPSGSDLSGSAAASTLHEAIVHEEAPFPISAIQMPSDMVRVQDHRGDEGSEVAEDEDGLFAGGDEEEDDSDPMEEVQTAAGTKRKLVEEDDYD